MSVPELEQRKDWIMEQAYYTVVVYKFSGIGQEATFENILAASQEDAMERVANSKPWLRLNPMYAWKQEKRTF